MRINLLIGIAVFAMSGIALAAGKGSRMHGGVGFLYPDGNSFSNPSQFAASSGTSVEAYYFRTSSGSSQALTTSATYGKGNFGLGVYVARSSTNFLDSDLSADSLGVGLGFALMKDKVNFGAGYARSLESGGGNGAGTATLTYMPKGKGVSFAVGATGGYTTTVTFSSATAAFGYQFTPNFVWELGVVTTSLSDVNAINPTTAIKMENNRFYAGAGYTYLRSGSSHSLQGRLGFMAGNFDASLAASGTVNSSPSYGGTVRVAF